MLYLLKASLSTFLLLLISWVNCQGCLNQIGNSVDWWVILKVPPKIGQSGFGYYDSTYRSSSFQYIKDHVDEGNTALTMTMRQINALSLESVAWNDEKPNNTTSFNLAHSKGFISYNYLNKRGFLISHSIPKYPNFVNHKVDLTIGASQNYYGQHLICVSMSLSELNKLAFRLMITRPFIYENSVINSSSTNYLADLGSGRADRVSVNFQTE